MAEYFWSSECDGLSVTRSISCSSSTLRIKELLLPHCRSRRRRKAPNQQHCNYIKVTEVTVSLQKHQHLLNFLKCALFIYLYLIIYFSHTFSGMAAGSPQPDPRRENRTGRVWRFVLIVVTKMQTVQISTYFLPPDGDVCVVYNVWSS